MRQLPLQDKILIFKTVPKVVHLALVKHKLSSTITQFEKTKNHLFRKTEVLNLCIKHEKGGPKNVDIFSKKQASNVLDLKDNS